MVSLSNGAVKDSSEATDVTHKRTNSEGGTPTDERTPRLSRRSFLSSATTLLAGCGSGLANFPFDRGINANSGSSSTDLRVTYFSVGCTLIERGGVAVLTDPFFTHLPLSTVAFGDVVPNPRASAPYLRRFSDVQAILVGHAHYDHVLDLPPVTGAVAPGARVLGSQTLKHVFANAKLRRPVVAVNNYAASPTRPGTWLTLAGGRVRVLPIVSGHPNQYLCFHLYADKLKQDLNKAPSSAGDYQEGMTLAYLVDFMAPDGQTRLDRVYIQTSSTGYPAGFFPAGERDKHPVRLAVLAMDCANIKARGQRSIIDYIQPRNVLFCHWEDFFRPKSGTPYEVMKVDLPDLRRKLKTTPRLRYIFPSWDSTHVMATRGNK